MIALTMLRRVFLTLVSIGFVFIVAFLVTMYFGAGRFIVTAINTWGPEYTKVKTYVSSVTLNPFSKSGSINGVFIGNPSGYQSKSAVEVDQIKIRIDASSLTKDQMIFDEVVIKSPLITLEGSLSHNNLSQIQKNISSSERKPASDSKRSILIRRLRVENAKVFVRLSVIDSDPIEVRLADFERKNIGGAQGEDPKIVVAEILSEVLLKSSPIMKDPRGLMKSGLKNAVDGLRKILP